MDVFGIVVALVSLLVAGMVLAVAKPGVAKKITLVFFVVAVVGGACIYGYGYMAVHNNALLAVLRTVPAICGMFLVDDCYTDIADTPLMQNSWMLTLFWLVRCYAIYTTVSTVVTAFGATAVRKLRLRFTGRGIAHLVYGGDENALLLGNALAEAGQKNLVFVAENLDKDRVNDMGGILRADTPALTGKKEFLRSIGCTKNRELVVYTLRQDAAENLQYARALLKNLEALDIDPQQLHLVIRAREDVAVDRLQVASGRYGYGYVTAVEETQLAARLLVRNYPPCHTLSFDSQGKATENFDALIVGFGQMGQAVLRSLVMSGQFEGSTFHAAVFAPDCKDVDGRLESQFADMLSNYDVQFYACDARSQQLYEYIRQRGNKLKYAVICAGNDKLNRELAEELTAYCKYLQLQLPMYLCSRQGVSACDSDGLVCESHDLYTPELLSNRTLDRLAMLLNHSYQGATDKSPVQTWMECDYFSRQSCRAAADFAESMLWMAGKTADQVQHNGWQLTDTQLENLSKTEHLRWCAFHYCMGFRTMDDKTLSQRGETYRSQLQEQGKATIRIGKDMEKRLHACLVPWEELDKLSEKEAAYTGKRVDYKTMDTDNVLALEKLLKITEE